MVKEDILYKRHTLNKINNMDWKITLSDILIGYFGDQSIETGINEMILVTESNWNYHCMYLNAITEGINASIKNDSEVIAILNDSHVVNINSFEEALQFLKKLYIEYLEKYLLSIRNDESN